MSERLQNLLSEPNPQLVESLTGLISEVVSALDEGTPSADKIEEINRLSGGQDYDETMFHKLYSWTSEREFAELAAMGKPPALEDITDGEIIDCLKSIREHREPQATYCLKLLQRSLPNAEIFELVIERNGTPPLEDILSEIRSARPATIFL